MRCDGVMRQEVRQSYEETDRLRNRQRDETEERGETEEGRQ